LVNTSHVDAPNAVCLAFCKSIQTFPSAPCSQTHSVCVRLLTWMADWHPHNRNW
jgi:hypothetical protein